MGKSTNRFGARYGRRIKDLFYSIEKEEKQKHKCPYCTYKQTKRVAKGIFVCKKCKSKFTGKAYVM